ncbi:hypothetical protein HAX54_047091 [Datura stramonium]|uniref:Uncharacterized protein n=1 Tax=Datura stramonium TaxID=4076 RepID=A0ABS8SSG4_DATST|nr:hypothetical protein [Datura stramonium]
MRQHHGRGYFVLPWRGWAMVIAQGVEGLPLGIGGRNVTDACGSGLDPEPLDRFFPVTDRNQFLVRDQV